MTRLSSQPSTNSPSATVTVLPLVSRTTADLALGEMTIPRRVAARGGGGSCLISVAAGGGFGGAGLLVCEKSGRSAMASKFEASVRDGIFGTGINAAGGDTYGAGVSLSAETAHPSTIAPITSVNADTAMRMLRVSTMFMILRQSARASSKRSDAKSRRRRVARPLRPMWCQFQEPARTVAPPIQWVLPPLWLAAV